MQSTKIVVLAAVLVSLTLAGTTAPSHAQFGPQDQLCKTPPCRPHEPTEPATSSQSTTKRLSLNPYGSQLDGGASFLFHHGRAPIVLPTGRPAFYHGFSVPDDYKGGPLVIELLVESEAVGCNFNLRHDLLFRMGMDSGNVTGDLRALSASSFPFGFPSVNAIQFAAPGNPDETVKLRYEIVYTPLEPGDGIHFGFFRVAGAQDAYDSCDLPLHVGGMSIVYDEHPGLQGPGGLESN